MYNLPVIHSFYHRGILFSHVMLKGTKINSLRPIFWKVTQSPTTTHLGGPAEPSCKFTSTCLMKSSKFSKDKTSTKRRKVGNPTPWISVKSRGSNPKADHPLASVFHGWNHLTSTWKSPQKPSETITSHQLFLDIVLCIALLVEVLVLWQLRHNVHGVWHLDNQHSMSLFTWVTAPVVQNATCFFFKTQKPSATCFDRLWNLWLVVFG